jgi:hypothetical protein
MQPYGTPLPAQLRRGVAASRPGKHFDIGEKSDGNNGAIDMACLGYYLKSTRIAEFVKDNKRSGKI